MKKTFLIVVLIALLALPGLANKKTANSEKFRIKPIFYWTSLSPLIVHTTTNSEFGFGFTIIGADISLFEYKNFKFLSVGVGLQAYQKLVLGWHSYNYHDGYSYPYYGWGYKFFADIYGKFVPVKWKWSWMSEALKVNTYVEIGITHKKDITVGLTFSGNPFKKAKKNKESVNS